MIKKCIRCGCEFEAKGNRTQYCAPCKVEKHLEYNRERFKGVHKPKVKEPKKYSPKEGIEAIGRVVALVEKYNREHGTCLSYGKYVMMKEKGELLNEN